MDGGGLRCEIHWFFSGCLLLRLGLSCAGDLGVSETSSCEVDVGGGKREYPGGNVM